jgi:transcriptional regulator with XRE-family HTH domain
MKIKHHLERDDLQCFMQKLASERGLSNNALSKLIGVTPSTVSAYATSTESDFLPSTKNLGKIAEYLDVSFGSLATIIENRLPLPQMSDSGKTLLEDLASDKLDINGIVEILGDDLAKILAKAQINLSRIQLQLSSNQRSQPQRSD